MRLKLFISLLLVAFLDVASPFGCPKHYGTYLICNYHYYMEDGDKVLAHHMETSKSINENGGTITSIDGIRDKEFEVILFKGEEITLPFKYDKSMITHGYYNGRRNYIFLDIFEKRVETYKVVVDIRGTTDTTAYYVDTKTIILESSNSTINEEDFSSLVPEGFEIVGFKNSSLRYAGGGDPTKLEDLNLPYECHKEDFTLSTYEGVEKTELGAYIYNVTLLVKRSTN